ncbi:MAG: two component, sigma54 specific, transcriptional regulator, Fis family [Gemmatimonadetes bacterium]|nr:two component, sigma54 specific, transcriptional regulator, Fis family [Gemmatimonadota bacterium]
MTSVLVVDDDETIRETLADYFLSLGYSARSARTATEGRQSAAEHAPDVVLVDLRLPDASGLTLLEALRADDPELGIIMLTGHADIPSAVRAMQQGALDFLEKPVDLETLGAAVSRAAELVRLRREVAVLRARREDDGVARDPNAASDAAPSLERLIELAARHDDVPVLIVGETGTGKGFVARRIHERSSRAALPFVEVNGATLNATFLESELFGHERGAFTDAKQAKRGLLEVAARGTLFLDEVGELVAEVQPKLLKVLEDRTFRRLGGTSELTSEARVLAATNQPLEQRMREGRFRADLYYRLQVLTLTISPLRDRLGELPDLARAFAPREARLSSAALRAIERYAWPGNVRELKNTLWRAALLADGAEIEPRHLSLPHLSGAQESAPVTLAEAERAVIASALEATQGNKVQAAQRLGIARSTLLEKLKRMATE